MQIPIWLLVLGTAGTALLNADFLAPYLSAGGGTLTLTLMPLAGFAAALGVGMVGRDVPRRQFFVCLITVGLVVGLAFGRQLVARGDLNHPRGIHDGAVHTEEAAKVLLRGENPYRADYSGTAYAALNPSIPGGPAINVVWSHYIYPPANFILQAPQQAIGDALGIRADVRWIYMVAFVMVSGLIISMGRSWPERSQWLLLTLGNPLIWLHVVVGHNDILVALGVVAAAWGMTRQRWWLAGLAFGFALAAKQIAWVLFPLWAVWIWRLHTSGQTKAAKYVTLGTIGMAAVLIGPFVFWDGPALYDDLVRYASGSIPFSYPISGSTFLQFLHVFGWVDSPWTIITTAWFQALVGLPVLWLSARWFWRQPTASRWLTGASLLSLAVLLVSRYFNSNYLVPIMVMSIAAAVWQTQTQDST